MAELIDVACDICGQKYQWGPERVGSSTQCRECGTKFSVVEYTPPPEEDTNANSPWRWIKGACVALLVVTAVVGLGSLPFVRPAPARAVAADRQPPGAGFAQPAARAPGVLQNRPNLQADVDSRLKALREKNGIPVVGQPGNPVPGNPAPVLPVPVFPGSAPRVPTMPPRHGFGPRGRALRGAPPVAENKPEKQPSDGNAIESTVAPTGVPPVITGWNVAGTGPRKQVHLTGRGLQNTTKVQKLLGLALFDVTFTVVSDTDLQLNSAHLQAPGQSLFVVTTADGMAVAFSNEIKTIDSPESGELVTGPERIFFVKKGGVLTSQQPSVVLLEEGGRASIGGITAVGIVKKGAQLETAIATTLICEAGANVTQRHATPRANDYPTAITFCPLPRLSEGR